MLPHELRALRLAVKRNAERLIDQWSNREFVSQWAEEMAVDSWAAGIRAAAEILRNAKYQPDVSQNGHVKTLFMDHYLEGYDRAIDDMTALLAKTETD
jgi:predicted RNA-binding Zn ribbon-like protein